MTGELEYRDCGDHIEMSKDAFERWRSTITTLQDPDVMGQLRQSQDDIDAGRTRDWSAVKADLGLIDQ